MSISKRVILGFAIILLFSVIGFLIQYRLTQAVAVNTGFVSNSESVIRNSSRIQRAIIEMQSSSRGFLLTENELFLDPYYAGLKEIPTLFSEQRDLLKGSVAQLKNLDSLQLLHHSWMEYANHLIDTKKASYVSEAGQEKYRNAFATRLMKGEGIRLINEIKQKFTEFDRTEYHVRERRREQLKRSVHNANLIAIFILVIDGVIAFLTGYVIVKTISNRIKEMVSRAEKIAKGKFEIIEDHQPDELQTLSDSLNTMAGQLDKSFSDLARTNRELDQFAYAASHDLKAPLRGMYNILSWIEEDLGEQVSEELRMYHKKLQGRIIRLESLVNGLLDYARIGREAKIIEEFSLTELLTNLIDMLVQPNIKVEVRNHIQNIEGERILLEQVFTNLISNAVKFQNKEGQEKITITCEDNGNHYTFSVADNGIGIASEYHAKIFGLFQTLREKNETESTGIGLAIVKKIIDDKKGTLTIDSSVGLGTKFTFTWPKSRKDAVAQIHITR